MSISRTLLSQMHRLSAAALLVAVGGCQSHPAVTHGRPASQRSATYSAVAEAPVRDAMLRLDADAMRFHQYVVTLSDPFFEGRAPETRGGVLAAEYIARSLAEIGLQPAFGDAAAPVIQMPESSYAQAFEVQGDVVAERELASFTVGGEELALEADAFNALGASASGTVSGELVFVGYGIEEGEGGYTSFSGEADLDGRIALLLRFEPMDDQGQSIWSDGRAWSSASGLTDKITALVDRGAAGVILVNPPGADDPRAEKRPSTAGTRFREAISAPAIALETDVADRVVQGADAEGRSLLELRKVADAGSHEPIVFPGATVTLDIEMYSQQSTALNVGAFLAGRGALSDETIVIGAHYDHLGYGGSNSMAPSRFGEAHVGADDNASGTAGVLLAAEHLVQRYAELDESADARNILFLLFSGEEMGLLGSRHFVDADDETSGEIVAMLNMDMIGRLRDETLEVFGYGTSPQWEEWLPEHFEQSGLNVKTSNAGAGPSDHASFYRDETPVLSFFTGLHREYHTPDDTYALINNVGGAHVARLVTDIAFDIATRPETPTFQSTDSENTGTSRRAAARVRLGVMPGSYDETERGLLVGDVIPGGAAAKAGLQKDDRIVGWNGEEVVNVFSYMEALSGHKAGDVVSLLVERGDDTIEIQVTLEAWRGAE